MNLRDTVAARKSRDEVRPGDPDTTEESFGWIGWPGRIALIVAITVSPWMIGSVHNWALQILAWLVAIAAGSWWLEMAIIRNRKPVMPWVALFLLAGIVLGLFQIMPLPEGLAKVLAGPQNEIYSEWSSVAIIGMPDAAKISVDPDATLKQVLLLVVCVTGLVCGGGLFRRKNELVLLMAAISVNAVALAFFGLLQKFTGARQLFWTIELTQGGSLFASFVNRNNAAGYLLLGLAATVGLINYFWIRDATGGPTTMISREIPVWRQIGTWLQITLSELTASKLAVSIAGVFIAAAIMTTLSRGGVIALFCGALATMLFYGMARKPQAGGLLVFPLALAVILMSGWIGYSDELMKRFSAAEVLQADVSTDQGRLRSWSETLQSFPDMGWLGSGLGSYPSMHRINSTMTEQHIFEYAENQFVQSVVDGGLVAAMLLLVTVWLVLYYGLFLIYRGSSGLTIATGTMCIFLLSSQAAASIFDFGWYIPANALTLSVMVGAIGFQAHSLAGRLRKKTPLQIGLPGLVIKGLSLALFSGVILAAVVFQRQARLDQARIRNVHQLLPAELDLAATEKQIEEMTALVREVRGSRAVDAKYLGELWLRRGRLEYWNKLREGVPIAQLSAERRDQVEENLWVQTTPDRILEQARFLGVRGASSLAAEFLALDFLNTDFPTAAGYLQKAAKTRPLDPERQVLLAQIQLILGNDQIGFRMLEAATRMTPGSFSIHRQAAHAMLVCGAKEQATPHLRKMLELKPDELMRTASFIKGATSRLPRPLNDQQIVREVLPDNALLLFRFASDYVPEAGELREELLKKAAELLKDVAVSDHDQMLLKANVILASGDVENGIDCLRTALTSDPNDRTTRERLAVLLMQQGQLDEALEQAKRLLEVNSRHQPYIDLHRKIENELDERRKPGFF